MSDVKLHNKFASIKAVGFDVDGTLYHSTEELRSAVGKKILAEAARRLEKSQDDIAEEYLARREKYRSNTATLNSFGLPGEEIFQKIWDEIPIASYVTRDEKLVSMLQTLRKKYRLFIISNGSGKQVERKLAHLGIGSTIFDPRIYCYDREWVKPEPAPFLAAIESLNLKPEEIVYVGDRTDVDVDAAKAVGMRTIFVGGEYAGADMSCDTVYDVGLMLE